MMVPRTALLRPWPWRDCVKCVIAQRQLRFRPDDRQIASAPVCVTSCRQAVFLLCQRVLAPGLLTWSEISCDVENSKSFRSSRDCRVSQGHRLKGVAALHNYPALIFHCRWRQSRERTRQVARSETFRPADDLRYVRSPGLRHRSGPAQADGTAVTAGASPGWSGTGRVSVVMLWGLSMHAVTHGHQPRADYLVVSAPCRFSARRRPWQPVDSRVTEHQICAITSLLM
jgi:hypothetical protein